jgi:hypothetical protein
VIFPSPSNAHRTSCRALKTRWGALTLGGPGDP